MMVIAFASGAASTTAGPLRVSPQASRVAYPLGISPAGGVEPLRFRVISATATSSAASSAIEIGTFTEADRAMLDFAATVGAEEVDFSEFYLDDDE